MNYFSVERAHNRVARCIIRVLVTKFKIDRTVDYDKNLIEIGERMEHVAYRLSQQKHSLDDISKSPIWIKNKLKKHSKRIHKMKNDCHK